MIYVYIILGIAVIVITLLGFLGWKTKRVEARLKKKLGLEDSTTTEELDKAVVKFRQTQVARSHKEKRDSWLASKGYTVPLRIEKRQKTPKQLTRFQMAINRFRKLKAEDKIEIYSAKKNKYGIPYYEIRKTVSQQIRAIQ